MSKHGLIGTGEPVGRPTGIDSGKDNSASKSDSDDEATIVEMRKRFDRCVTAEQENRENYVKDLRMSSSADQWDEEVKKKRGLNRPAMTFNMLNLVVKQIIGDYRQNKLNIKVLPAGAQSTDQIADIFAGLIRHIERDSHAEYAYTNALECACRGNIGWIRVMTEYEADDVFHQKLVIRPVHNSLTVYCDPAAKLITRSDAEFMFITERMNKEDYKRKYPKAEPGGWDLNSDDYSENWESDDDIRLCEYYTKEKVNARLAQFDSGAVVQIDSDDEIKALEQIGWKVVKEREAERVNIRWRRCSGFEVLEERVYKTKTIPVIPVLGEEVNVEGKTLLRSAVFYALDSQKSYNYERSTSIERNALSAKAPWKVTQKEIEQWKEQWDNVNNTPQPYLVFSVDPAHPQGPERIEPPTPAAAEIQSAQAAAQDLQRTTGIFDAQLGQKSNVLSGVGLSEQQSQGATSTFIFPDNARTGIEHCGRVLVDWIPVVYDTERVVRVISTEEDISLETVNQQKANPILGITEVLNDITVGKYDVIVTAGKAFASRRREAVDGMLKFAQAFPQQGALVSDLIIGNMDVPGGEVMAERIKRSLPPQITTDPDSPEGQQAAQAAQAQQQQGQQLQQQLLQGKLQTEQGKNQASLVKSQADVVKSQAEVTRAKADTIQAIAQTHSALAEQAVSALDNGRMGNQGPQNLSPATQPVPQPVVQPPAAAPPQPAAQGPDSGMNMLAQHLMAQHQAQAQRDAALQQILQSVAQSHQAIAQHLASQNTNGIPPYRPLVRT